MYIKQSLLHFPRSSTSHLILFSSSLTLPVFYSLAAVTFQIWETYMYTGQGSVLIMEVHYALFKPTNE